MSGFRIAALALAAALSAVAAGAQALYAPPEADFAVAFPDPPQVTAKPAARSRDVAARRYVDQQPGRAMIVSIEDYPDGALPASADAGVYDRILRGLAEDRGSRLVSTRAARLAGRPCLEGTMVDSSGDTEMVRVLLVGSRIYQLTYAVPEGAEAQGGDAAFFGSFRITKAP